MAALVEVKAEHRIAGLAERMQHRGVGRRAGVGMHNGVLGTKERFQAIDGELFNGIDVLTAVVVAIAGVAHGVLVLQHRSLRFKHRRRCEAKFSEATRSKRRLLPGTPRR